MDEWNQLPLALWIALPILLTTQGTWLFIDARKHSRYPWFWGLWGLVYFPLPLLLYSLIVRKVHHQLYKRWTKKG